MFLGIPPIAVGEWPKRFLNLMAKREAESYPTQDFLPGYKSGSLAARERIEQGDQLMSKHITISPSEAADRLAIRELVEAYAHCADRRDAKGQMALFTPDTHFVVYMNAKDPTPSQELHSRVALAPVFADLNKYAATMHFVGQSTILTLTGDRATGEAYTLAHHLTINGEKRRLMIAALRYSDNFVKIDGAWLFAERLLYVDWLEERELS
jgi:SnoaL-like domain